MAPRVTIIISLDPFLQEMLRGIYDNYNKVFSFPNGDDLIVRLRNLLRPLPEDYASMDFKDRAFEIEIPASPSRDPFYYRYLSKTAMKVFEKKVKEFARMVFHERMTELRNDGYEYKDSIDLFMDEFQISPDHTDRITKDYYRWRSNLRVKKYRKNTTKKARVLSSA